MLMEVIKLIQSFSNPFLDIIFQLVTMIGEDAFFIIVTAVIYWCIDKELGYKLGFVTLTSACINFGLKDLLKVPRPIGEPGIRSLRVHTAEGYSFPSGHTQNTATLWTFFMVRYKRRWLYAIGTSVILLVAVSRLYLGVHTVYDVAGGMLIGAAWVVIWSLARDKSVLLLFNGLALTGLLVFRDNNYYKTVGALTGLLAGHLIEPRFIDFQEKASALMQVIKVTAGLSSLYALRIALKLAMPETLAAELLRYFLLLLWVTVAIPYGIKRLTQKQYRF
jgi:membrane-associated phospholipid phosphatase